MDTTRSIDITDISADYSRQDLVEGFRMVGLVPGDVVYMVVGLAKLGNVTGCPSSEQLCDCLLGALQDVVGANGTILIPTYTFSFCKGEIFDVQNTPAIEGPWSPSRDFPEFFRKQPGVLRSRDPIHSVAGLGPKAAELLSDLPSTCFGENSVPHRLRRMGGKICAAGLGLHESNFQHHVEEMLGVPFRFKKLFKGQIKDNGAVEKKDWLYNVGILAKNGLVDENRLEKRAREAGICRAGRIGRGELLGINSRELFEFTSQALTGDPWFTAQGPAADPVELERLRVGGPHYEVSLPANASASEMIQAIRKLPCHIVSEGYDAALAALATQVPMKIHKYPTGTECWSWIIPEKWTCHEAYLETLDGRRLFSYADNPRHVVSYSLPFEGEISRRDLFEHLHVHGKISEAVPYIFGYYERDWGLCCSKKFKDTLLDERYKVVIKSDFSFGALKVGEVIAPGEVDECIILCAHLCHPAAVNDDLSGVVVGIKVMQDLLRQVKRRYTYRFLIVPETVGAIAYLSHNGQLIPKMKGGLFLEMLGLNAPHALQLSFAGNSEVDLCFSMAFKNRDSFGWTSAYGTNIGNDVRRFNAPDVRVPMLSLSRRLPPTAVDWPHREHDSSYSALDVPPVKNLERSCDLVLSMIDTIENNRAQANRVKRECSAHGLAF